MSEMYRRTLDEYGDRYSDFIRFRRENGILEVRFHTDDAEFQWNLEAHSGIIAALFDINHDPENECVIITGTGSEFCAQMNDASWRRHGFDKGYGAYQGYDISYHGQTREPFALLDLKIPVIAAVNGPSIVHAELALLNDIVICSDNTFFYEGHWDGLGVVPGDGVHTLYRELLGYNRGRYFLLTGQRIYADEALALGLVGEVLPLDKLLDRAWELAETVFMSKNRVQRRLTRSLLVQPWRELFTKELPLGMAHEAFGGLVHWPMGAEEDFDIERLQTEADS